MDVNGLPMWLIAGRRSFGLAADGGAPSIAINLDYQGAQGHVRLSPQQEAPQLAEDETFARRMASRPRPCATRSAASACGMGGQAKARGLGLRRARSSCRCRLPIRRPCWRRPTSLWAPTSCLCGPRRRGGDEGSARPLAAGRGAPRGYRAGLVAPMPDGGAWAFDRQPPAGAGEGRPLRFTGLRDADPEGSIGRAQSRSPRLAPVRRGTFPPASRGRDGGLAQRTVGPARLGDRHRCGCVQLRGRGASCRFRLAMTCASFSLAWCGAEEIAVLASDGAAIAPGLRLSDGPADVPERRSAAGRAHPPLIKAGWRKFSQRAGRDAAISGRCRRSRGSGSGLGTAATPLLRRALRSRGIGAGRAGRFSADRMRLAPPLYRGGGAERRRDRDRSSGDRDGSGAGVAGHRGCASLGGPPSRRDPRPRGVARHPACELVRGLVRNSLRPAWSGLPATAGKRRPVHPPAPAAGPQGKARRRPLPLAPSALAATARALQSWPRSAPMPSASPIATATCRLSIVKRSAEATPPPKARQPGTISWSGCSACSKAC